MTRDLSAIAQELIATDPALAEEIRKQLSVANVSTLTPRQRECFEFIKSYVAEYQSAPTLAVIADALGSASRSSAFEVVRHLKERGLIKRSRKGRRAIYIVEHVTA